MLTAATATGSGLAADPALPQRELLLDPERVADRLAARLGADGPLFLDGCELVRVKYRIGESLRVVYRLHLSGGSRLVAARAFTGGASARAYTTAVKSTLDAGELRPVLHDAGVDAVWWSFPNDRRIRGLAAVLSADHSVASLVPSPAASGWRTSEVVEYAPERSATFRCLGADGSPVAYAKVYAPGTSAVASLAGRYGQVAAYLATTSVPVTSPRALASSGDRELLLLEAMSGTGWGDLSGSSPRAGLRSLGAAIGTLHQAPVPAAGLARFARLDASRIAHSAELIGRARPDVATAVARLAGRLTATRPSDGELVVLHGDCHPKNALLDGSRVALIDLDQAGLGPPAADVGSLLARLRHGALLGEHAGADADQLAAAFLTGYAGVRPVPPAPSLRWHVAAALLVERAMRAVNRVHRPALAQLGELLEMADRSLDEEVPS